MKYITNKLKEIDKLTKDVPFTTKVIVPLKKASDLYRYGYKELKEYLDLFIVYKFLKYKLFLVISYDNSRVLADRYIIITKKDKNLKLNNDYRGKVLLELNNYSVLYLK